MKNDYKKIAVSSLIIVAVGVFIIDYFSHLLFSNPMETLPYFFAKAALFFVFSFAFLSLINLKMHEFLKILVGGIVVSSLWGIYYNVLPAIFDYYPFGIPLRGLSFLNMGLFGTGLAFGTVHTIAFLGGYYVSEWIWKFVK